MLCKCNHKIAYYKTNEFSKTPLPSNLLAEEAFRHVSEPRQVKENGKVYLDMQDRHLTIECPYCDCKGVEFPKLTN